MRGIVTSPYKWKVLGSIDNNSYTLLHSVNRSLCNVTQRFDSECVETFAMSNIKKVKYIKVINTNGECQGKSYYFGLHGVDFYGTGVQNTIVICKRSYKTIIVCLILAVFIS